jgi:hypothetical protein
MGREWVRLAAAVMRREAKIPPSWMLGAVKFEDPQFVEFTFTDCDLEQTCTACIGCLLGVEHGHSMQ